MLIKEVIQYIESIAPPQLQESYDNSGLLTGNARAEVQKSLVCLDVTEAVVEEAIEKKCQLIISHHPLIFSGLKSLTGRNYVERSLIKALKNDIAIYAIHTNLDNIHKGVNARIARQLGIRNPSILQPKKGLLKKLVTYVPVNDKDEVLQALFSAGAGGIGNYDECSFQLKGTGSFRGNEDSNPHLGEKGKRHYEEELRIEVVLPVWQEGQVLKALWEAHPYEEVAYDLYALENTYQQAGAGMIGMLDEPLYALDFIGKIKEAFGGVVRYTPLVKDQVQKIAWCGGSGSFLLQAAKKAGADVFISSDFKYHQFFDAENEIVIADIGHYENEQYTQDLIASLLKEKFSNFAVLLTETNTNPINYL